MTSRSAESDAGSMVLAEGYYVSAFLVVLDTVAAHSSDLLTTEERCWEDRIKALTDPARRLYVRLLQRRAATFRLGKLSYEDIPDITEAADELVDAGLGSNVPPVSIRELADAFTVPELERMTPSGCKRSARRPERIAAIVESDSPANRHALAGADQWLTLNGHEHFNVFRLCFFGNLYQDLSEFVTTSLGTNRYESVPLDHPHRYFRSREQLDAHLRHYECSQLFDMQVRHDHAFLQQLLSMLPVTTDADPHLERRLDRLQIRIARALERLDDVEAALELYALCRRAPARERRVRLLEQGARRAEADALLRSMLAEPEGEAEQDFARKRLFPRSAENKAFRPLTTTLVLPNTAHRVEQIAATYFSRDGACYWVENRLLTSLLGLWIWDIMFMPIRGAFFHPFQSGPADFRERSFRERRSAVLADRFAEMHQAGAFEKRVRENALAKAGVSNPLVSWDLVASPVFEHALERIPLSDLSCVFDRMLDDLAENTSGLPDLVHFPDIGGYELIEIKGPGDALQANQRRWFRYFNAHGIAARMVKVRWKESGG